MKGKAPAVRYLVVALLTGMLLAGLRVYPESGMLLPALLCLAIFAVYRYPLMMWLYLPPALALLDLAPVTGWYFFEEIDLLLLATAAVGYARLGGQAIRPAGLARPLRCAAMLLALALCCALLRGLPFSMPIDFMAMNDYLSPYNSLRMVKAWLWAWLYLPLLRHHTARYPALPEWMLQSGLVVGLLLVTYCAMRERWQFPGMFNLASDYRITAPFSSMHTGGAALDGYLAMCLPVLALWLWRPERAIQRYVALCLLPPALYVALATFSRGLYLGLACACLLLVFGMPPRTAVRAGSAYQTANTATQTRGRHMLVLLSLLVQLQLSFLAAGYRGMLAAAVVMLAVALPAPASSSSRLAELMGYGLIFCAVVAVACPPITTEWMVLKPAYMSLLLSAGIYYWMLSRSKLHAPFWLGYMIGNSIWICIYHAGMPALPLACSIIPLGFVWLRLLHSGRARSGAADALPAPTLWALTALVIAVTVIPFYNGYFVGARFARTQSDLRGRWQHWQDVYTLMAVEPYSYLIGAGAGRFPALYYWFNRRGEIPAHATFIRSSAEAYLHLQAGSYPQGYGQTLQVLQKINLKPQTAYRLSLDVAGGDTGGFLLVQICARQLLYPAHCSGMPQHHISAHASWHRITTTLLSGTLASSRLPLQLQLSADGNGAVIDVDNVSLIELATGEEVLRNGTFNERHNYWFFSSDHHHLPWHIKNLLLNLYFEYGLAGLSGYLLLLAYAVSRLLVRSRLPQQRAGAMVWLAALGGFEVVGLFDSLIDVPRILLLHLLILLMAILSCPAEARSQHA